MLARIILLAEEMIIILGSTFVLSEEITIEFSSMKTEEDPITKTAMTIELKSILKMS
jgi:hypothetical protein